MTLIDMPCTARELETALHAVCDHHGAWDAEIRYGLRDVEPFRTGFKAVPTLEIKTKGETK